MPPTLIFAPPAVPPPAATLAFSNVTEQDVVTTSARVRWNVSPNAQGEVRYGTVSGTYDFVTTRETGYLGFHSQPLAGLVEGTTYYYVVWGRDASGNEGTSAEGSFDTQGTPTTTPGSPGTYYGIWTPLTGVSNLRMFDEPTIGSFRFRADYTGYVRFVRWSNTTGSGYWSGIGFGASQDPVARISIQADDGTPRHLPTGTILSQVAAFTPPNVDDAGTLSGFSSPYRVTSGELYHVVFENTAGGGSSYSINCTIDESGSTSPRWGVGSLDMGALFYNNGDWEGNYAPSQRGGHSPIVELHYADTAGGSIVHYQGQGFVTMDGPVEISGNRQARERIIVSGGDKVVDAVVLYCENVSGSNPLTVTLEDSSSAVLRTATFPASDFVQGGTLVRNTYPYPRPVERPFESAYTMTNGSTYYVRLSTPAGTTFMTEDINKGTGWGYDASVCFADGVRQGTSNGSSWTTYGNTDLQIMLRFA